jgi:hypothetical protein
LPVHFDNAEALASYVKNDDQKVKERVCDVACHPEQRYH